MKGQGLVEYVLILVMVMVVVIALLLIFKTEYSTVFSALVTDKQDIHAQWQGDDLVITATVDGRKQTFLARNGIVYVSISIGDTCDFETYAGGQGTTVISKATCIGDKQ